MWEAGPEGSSIGEDWEDDRLEYSSPVHKIETSDGVAKHV